MGGILDEGGGSQLSPLYTGSRNVGQVRLKLSCYITEEPSFLPESMLLLGLCIV